MHANSPAALLTLPIVPCLLLFPWPAWSGDLPRYSIDSSRVMLSVSVTDQRGKALTGLRPDHFRLFEDSRPKEILSFSTEDVPVTAGVVLDLSGSMAGRLHHARAAARAVADVADPADELFLITFSDEPQLHTSAGDPRDALRPLENVPAGGATALVDAVMLGLHRTGRSALPRSALIVISDGDDNHSRYSWPELLSFARERDVAIHTVAIREYVMRTAQRRGARLLQELSEVTGGLHFTVQSHEQAPAAVEKIARAMKQVYTIGFRAEPGAPGKWRKLRVNIRTTPATPVRVAARSGYFLPE